METHDGGHELGKHLDRFETDRRDQCAVGALAGSTPNSWKYEDSAARQAASRCRIGARAERGRRS